MQNKTRSNYCYGIQMTNILDGFENQNGYDDFCILLQPDFKKKLDAWLNQAMVVSKSKLGFDWDEQTFWELVLKNHKDYGAFDSFEQLFEDTGLHLVECYPNALEWGPVPPYILGDYIYSKAINKKYLVKKQKPKFYHSLCKRLSIIFSALREADLQIFEVYDFEDAMEPFNSFDPNFMTSEDY